MRKREWAAHKEALRELRLRHEDEYHQILAKKLAALPPPVIPAETGSGVRQYDGRVSPDSDQTGEQFDGSDDVEA